MWAETGSSNWTRAGLRFAAASLIVGIATVSVEVLPAQVAGATPSGNTYYVNSATDTSFTVLADLAGPANDCTSPSNTGCGIDDAIAFFNADSTAGNADTIVFSPSVTTFTVGQPTLISNTTSGVTLAIDGQGPLATAVSGAGAATVFTIDSGTTVSISDLTVEDGFARGPAAGIVNSGTLTLSTATISGNTTEASCVFLTNVSNGSCSATGAGIYNGGTMTITDSTVSDNSASESTCIVVCNFYGAGITNRNGTLTITATTVSGNTISTPLCAGDCFDAGDAGGIFNSLGTVQINSSTVSGNDVTEGACTNHCHPPIGELYNDRGTLTIGGSIVADGAPAANCAGTITDQGYNITDDASCAFGGTGSVNSSSTLDASLGALGNNGGPTETIKLLSGSPAIGLVNSATLCATPDQRGTPRPTPVCDAGAYETSTLFTSSTPGFTPAIPDAIPTGICSVEVVADGGHGHNGGAGAEVTAAVAVTAGDHLGVEVAGGGTSHGGGIGGGGGGLQGGGGGASAVSTGAGVPLVVAGGGGGGFEAGGGGTPAGGNVLFGAFGGDANGNGGAPQANGAGGGGVADGGPGNPGFGGAGGGGNGFVGGGGGGGEGFGFSNGPGGAGSAGGSGTHLGGTGQNGDDSGGTGNSGGGAGGAGGIGGNSSGSGGGAGGIGFGGGGGGSGNPPGGGGGAGYGGGAGGRVDGSGAGGSSYVITGSTPIPPATSPYAPSSRSGDGQVTITYDPVADACPTSTVTYNANTATSGSPPTDGSSPYLSGQTVTVLGNTGSLQKTGYSFGGWNTAANGTGTAYAPASTFTILGNTVLYAQWTPNSDTVTYNANTATSGSAPTDGSSPYLSGQTVTVLGNTGSLQKTGYSFGGWNTAANGTGTAYAPASTFTILANTVLYAQWTPNSDTVTYNANTATSGSAPTDGSSPYLSGQTVTVLGNTGSLQKTGYSFGGWNTAANGTGTAYAPASTFTILGNTVLYAQWTPNSDTVTYNANTATSGSAPTDGSSPYLSGQTVTVLGNTGSLQKTGYSFGGWNTAANGTGTAYAPASTFTILGNTVLYAQWTPNSDTVTYNANTATSGSAPTDGSSPYLSGQTVTVLGNTGSLQKTGYSFGGWNTAANGTGTAYAPASTFTILGNTVLYAQWTPNSDTVTYNANTATSGSAPTDGSSPYLSGQTVTVLGNTGSLQKTGYSFGGWNTAANGTGTAYAPASTFTILGNTVLYAQWTPNSDTVTYNANTATSGSAPTDGSSPYLSGQTVTVLGNTGSLQKTGYSFGGWNTAANGTGTAYAPASTFTILGNTVLYAQWTPNSDTVTYNANTATSGSAPTDGSSPYLSGQTVTVLGNTGSLQKTGYSFGGWNTAANGTGTAYAPASTFTILGNTVLYAQWTSLCAAGLQAHVLTGTYGRSTFTGLFCVNAKGVGTYTQGTVHGTGTITVSGATTWIAAYGKNLALLGTKTAKSSTYVETAPAPIKAGTFTLS